MKTTDILVAGLALGLALGLIGCVVPRHEAPAVAVLDESALGLMQEPLVPVTPQWWRAFGDPQLDQLVDDAGRNSPSLAQALARVRLAQAQHRAIDAANEPHFTVDGDASWQRFSEHYYIPPPYGGSTYWVSQAAANLHWDLDFWGHQAALIGQSRSLSAASALDLAAARLALAGSIAQAYVDLDRAWQLLDIATRLEAQRAQLLKLTQQRRAAGLDTQIEVKIAESGLPQARAARLQAESSRDLAVHRLTALAGYGVDRYAQFVRPQLQLEVALPLPEQLPLDLLARRPDVLAARMRVTAATAGREAAYAAFYPDLSLKGFVGVQSIGLDNLLKGGSVVYGVGPALHLPIFDSQRLRAAYQGATAELDESIANYNASVLNAVRESADQLALYESFAKQITELEHTLQTATEAYELARKRYAAGLATQLVVLNAESRVLDVRREVAAAKSNHVIARVTLLLMLGGSFDPAAPVASAALESSR
jgi:NodT family efflux transporter outer membrane factor (OMF) lipoprotein